MSILRRVHSGNFTIVGNACLCDEALSAEALGVLCYLIGRPHDWVVQPGQLANRFACGRDRIQRVIRELIAAGYVLKAQRRAENTGVFLGIEYIVLDTKNDVLPEGLVLDSAPQPENPVTGERQRTTPQPENPATGNPATGNPTLQRTEATKTEKHKAPMRKRKVAANAYTEEFERDVWQPYPRKQNTSKINAFKKWQMLSPELQTQLKASIPAFVLSKRGTEERFIPHLEFYISRQIFETVASPAGPQATHAPQIDRPTWEGISRMYANNSNWHRQWGPEPGKPGCLMPPDLQKNFVNPGLTVQ